MPAVSGSTPQGRLQRRFQPARNRRETVWAHAGDLRELQHGLGPAHQLQRLRHLVGVEPALLGNPSDAGGGGARGRGKGCDGTMLEVLWWQQCLEARGGLAWFVVETSIAINQNGAIPTLSQRDSPRPPPESGNRKLKIEGPKARSQVLLSEWGGRDRNKQRPAAPKQQYKLLRFEQSPPSTLTSLRP